MGLEKSPKLTSREESTRALVTRVRSGDRQALIAVHSRYLVPFQRWVKCRTPAWARGSTDTEQLVEKTLSHSLDDAELEPGSVGCFQSHLRRRILAGLKGELSRVSRSSKAQPYREGPGDPRSSMLEKTLGREAFERYESALRKLRDEDREAIIARLELNFTYPKIAAVLGKSTPEEARNTVIGALLKLAQEMGVPP